MLSAGVVGNRQPLRFRAAGKHIAQSLGELPHVARIDLLPTLCCSLPGSLAGLRIGEALPLRPLESRLFNQHSLALVSLSGPTEPNDHRAERRVFAGTSGQSRVAAGEEHQMVEVGTGEAERAFSFHSEKSPLAELTAAFRTGRITEDPEDDDIARISTGLTAARGAPSLQREVIRHSARATVGPYSDEVVVRDRPNVPYAEREQRLRSARGRNEFDFKPVRLIDLDYGAEIPLTEATVWQFSIQNDNIESPVSHGHPSG
jgi:hypothetical protein